MNNAVKLGAGVAGGYVLGRTKKLKLAVGLGAWLIGKKLDLSPTQLAMSGFGQLKDTPEFAELSDRLRNEVGGAGKRALSAAATSRIDGWADRLRDVNDGVYDEDDDDSRDEDEPRDEQDGDDEYDDEYDDDLDGEPRDEDEGDEDDYDDEDEPRDEHDDDEQDEDEDDDEDDDEGLGDDELTDDPYPDEERTSAGSGSNRRRTTSRRR